MNIPIFNQFIKNEVNVLLNKIGPSYSDIQDSLESFAQRMYCLGVEEGYREGYSEGSLVHGIDYDYEH